MILKVKPIKMQIYVANGKLTCAQVRQKTGCDICINGTLYNMSNYEPCCDVKVDGVVMSNDQYRYQGYGWNKNAARAVISTEMEKWDNYISCLTLIVDSVPVTMYYGNGLKGTRGRTAFGYKADGTMVIYCGKDRTSAACTPEKLQAKMLEQGCVDAICLDGGGSSQLDSDEGKITSSRKVANYICIWTEPKCPYNEPVLNVKKNSRGNGARWFQWMLNHVCDAGLFVDGIFGPKSVAALRSFQEDSGLVVDGIGGKKTRAALIAQFES